MSVVQNICNKLAKRSLARSSIACSAIHLNSALIRFAQAPPQPPTPPKSTHIAHHPATFYLRIPPQNVTDLCN